MKATTRQLCLPPAPKPSDAEDDVTFLAQTIEHGAKELVAAMLVGISLWLVKRVLS